MKCKFWLGLTLILLAGSTVAQTYTLSVETADYESLQGGQSLVDDVWDDPSFTVPLGFTFTFFTEEIQSLVVDPGFSYASLAAPPVDDIFSLLIPCGADLVDRGYLDSIHLSPIRYKVTGSQGDRITTVEWSNAGFYGDLFSSGTSTDYIHFQVRIYESNGDIVFHFGPNHITDPGLVFNGAGGPVVGLAEQYNVAGDVVLGETLLLSGDPSDPDVHTDYASYALSAPIPENTLYRFSREQTGVLNLDDAVGQAYFGPNPTLGPLHVFADQASEIKSPVRVYNVTGQCVGQFTSTSNLNLEYLQPGMYQLTFVTDHGLVSERHLLIR